MQNLLARLIHAREEDDKEKEKDKDVDDLEDDDLDEDDDEDFDDDDDDWDDDDDDDDDEEKEGEEEAGAERRRASRRGAGRAADAARVFDTSSAERYAPATVMRAILSVGAAIALRGRRSLPTISMSRSMSRRFPAMVSSSTGWASSPFSIHSPAAPRE